MIKVRNIIDIGIGGMFIVAAILKLISLDEFEIYIYSFNILSFPVTTFVSRVMIVGEFIMGLFLILKIYYEITRKAIFSVLILFTLFLMYTAIFRNDDNCHCFGELVELNPVESIIKNVVVMCLLLIANKLDVRYDEDPTKRRPARYPLLIVVFLLLLVFVVSPPDTIYKMIYSADAEVSSMDLYESFDEVEYIHPTDTMSFHLDEEKQVIVIASAGCKYCKLGLKKLSLMKNKGDIDVDKISVFIWGSPEGIAAFREETATETYPYWHIMPNKAIDVTYGRFPVFILMEDKKITDVKDFRDL